MNLPLALVVVASLAPMSYRDLIIDATRELRIQVEKLDDAASPAAKPVLEQSIRTTRDIEITQADGPKLEVTTLHAPINLASEQ